MQYACMVYTTSIPSYAIIESFFLNTRYSDVFSCVHEIEINKNMESALLILVVLSEIGKYSKLQIDLHCRQCWQSISNRWMRTVHDFRVNTLSIRHILPISDWVIRLDLPRIPWKPCGPIAPGGPGGPRGPVGPTWACKYWYCSGIYDIPAVIGPFSWLDVTSVKWLA